MQHAELLRDWHPLDHTTPPEYVPPYWAGFHVGLRLVEGLRVLKIMRMRDRGPQQFGNAWPAYAHDWEDQLAQLEADEAQKLVDAREKNFVRLVPSASEIARMEQVIAWPARYLRDFPQLLRTVQIVALLRARHRDMRQAARRLDLPARLVRRWNREGLDTIAFGLIRDRIPIF
jgi:hypothetical protein